MFHLFQLTKGYFIPSIGSVYNEQNRFRMLAENKVNAKGSTGTSLIYKDDFNRIIYRSCIIEVFAPYRYGVLYAGSLFVWGEFEVVINNHCHRCKVFCDKLKKDIGGI